MAVLVVLVLGFDVTMGSFDGAETCELVGLYLLSQLKNLYINVGLYRDDGLAVTTQIAIEAESTKKKISKIFKDNGFNITIEANKKAVDFLDISFDLRTGPYKPY
ncbi:DNA polymerase [Plakobranchus ocellatus]|uniref:DNA polymerase n=1 Tax=Plakobranchus ocellatus TaxID=259542 RepID=A0AAV4CLC1_9GAST|nr:DNA polymerase [Plakobranchus ocellatus]